MSSKKWPGIMKIKYVEHRDCVGELINRQENIRNTLHSGGEAFLIQAAFIGGPVSSVIPDTYFIGLDNRESVAIADEMADIVGEPATGGYARNEVSSTDEFSLVYSNGLYSAVSPVLTFRSTSASWGPCANVFLAAEIDDEMTLLATAVLGQPISLGIGETITMRLSLQIRDND